ncbi:MAG: SurA N-terminal domain-containing protein [Chloroflexia bacterium]
MRDSNPYDVLQVPRDAGEEEIEEAYNALFDRYEPSAHEGDEAAISMLHALNDARDALVDPRQRAALDAELPGVGDGRKRRGAAAGGGAGSSRMDAGVRSSGSRVATMGTVAGRPRDAYARPRSAGAKRPRSVAPVSRRSTVPLIIGGVLLFIVAVVAVFFISRGLNGGTTGGTPAGNVVATVNGVPIYMRDYQERLAKDKANAMNDPFFSGLANNFQGITGTRMLDVLSFDALDKLINLEVIQQEAKKEKLYPTTDAEKKSLIDQAKQNDLQGKSFDQFLKEHNISEEQYNNSVIANTVYAIMAGKYMPQTGTDDEKTQAFITWMCEKRQGYDVKINLTFQVQGNKACSSGLPSDVPVTNGTSPSEEGTQAPGPESTQAPPVPTQANPVKP